MNEELESATDLPRQLKRGKRLALHVWKHFQRSEEHTSELQSLTNLG